MLFLYVIQSCSLELAKVENLRNSHILTWGGKNTDLEQNNFVWEKRMFFIIPRFARAALNVVILSWGFSDGALQYMHMRHLCKHSCFQGNLFLK